MPIGYVEVRRRRPTRRFATEAEQPHREVDVLEPGQSLGTCREQFLSSTDRWVEGSGSAGPKAANIRRHPLAAARLSAAEFAVRHRRREARIAVERRIRLEVDLPGDRRIDERLDRDADRHERLPRPPPLDIAAIEAAIRPPSQDPAFDEIDDFASVVPISRATSAAEIGSWR